MADDDRSDALKTYRDRRNFNVTPEPAEGGVANEQARSFVIQKHWATRLHYDFRLELDGTMKSWAVPKGPSLDPADKRMAMPTEDHPIAYNCFEGTIPPGNYGAGQVIIWDKGSWIPLEDPHKGFREGKLKFELRGHKLHGHWTLVRMKGRGQGREEPWLLIKEGDHFARPASEFNVVDEMQGSVKAPQAIAREEPQHKVPPPDAPAPVSAGRPARKARPAAADAAQPSSLRVSHPERVIDPASGTTKLGLVRYYAEVAPLMMEHLKNRPVALVRAPAGIGGELFFQKHAERYPMEGIAQLDPALDPGHPPLLEVATAQGLLSAAQMNVIEFHTWNAVKTAIGKPDRMTFDLDPGEGVDWPEVQEAAVLVRALLTELGLPAWLKTSGGKGLHVVVPLKKQHGWDTVKDFSQAIVQHLARTIPQRFVAKSGPRNRVGRIFIDYLRNGYGATTVCAWSARSRPGLGISVPVHWEELQGLGSGAHWTVSNVHERLEQGNTPWDGYEASRAPLAGAMKTLGFQRG